MVSLMERVEMDVGVTVSEQKNLAKHRNQQNAKAAPHSQGKVLAAVSLVRDYSQTVKENTQLINR